MFLTLPLLVYISFDSPAGIGKPQTNCLGAFNGCPGLKGKTSLGDIQDSAAVVRVEIDIGGSVHCHPWTVASLRPHERYSPCVILGCFSVQSSRGTESGQTVTASQRARLRGGWRAEPILQGWEPNKFSLCYLRRSVPSMVRWYYYPPMPGRSTRADRSRLHAKGWPLISVRMRIPVVF